MNRRRGILPGMAVLAAASLALAGCGSNTSASGGSSSGSGGSSSSSPGQSVKANGTLTIGTLLPETGDLAFLGPPEFAGVQAAINDINKAGGVLGKKVTEVKADSGDGTPDIAGQGVSKLQSANADVVVGAASSSVSLSVIDQITNAGLVQISPANTSPQLDQHSTDPHNLYFRTAPSDVLQGAVLANTILGDGHQRVAILARQDSYGELLANQVAKGVKSGGGTVTTKQLYSADAQNFTAEVNKVAATHPDAIAVIAFDEVKKIIPEMIGAGIGPNKQQIYFTDGDTADYSKDFKPGTLKGVKGTYPGAKLTASFKKELLKTDPKLTTFTYGPESYDATMLVALAAVEAKSDSPTQFSKHIIDVSQGGTPCTSFKACAALLKKGKDIDYNGVSGPVDLGKTGSPKKATIDINLYGKNNTFKTVKYINGVIPG